VLRVLVRLWRELAGHLAARAGAVDLLDGSLRIDRYASQTGDKALYGGHVYSDKAPGISFLAVPTVGVMRLSRGARRPVALGRLLWIARLLTGGIAYLVAIVLLRFGAEQLRPRAGDRVGVAFGLGTLALPLAATTVGHVAAGALAFGAFLLVSARSRLSNKVLLGQERVRERQFCPSSSRSSF
jgi:hypothetical protein